MKGDPMIGDMWSNMFHLALPVMEKILRPIFVYLFMVIGIRLAGKRELAQLNPFDLVVVLMLSNTVQNAIIGDDTSVTGGFLGAASLLVFNHLVVRALYKDRRLANLIEGKAEPLIENGAILEDKLAEELIALEELEEGARRQGIASLNDCERAILEDGGTVSFIEKRPSINDEPYRQLIERFDALSADLAEVKAILQRQKI
jgi:uncharacterized membrane protein YcaP (DUF421 family)